MRDALDPTIDIEVGRIRWRDLVSLRSIRQRYFLDHPGRNPISAQPFDAGIRKLVPLVPSSDRVVVARANKRVLGYAVFSVRNPDRRWVLAGIGANLGIYESQPLWDELVQFGVVAAGLEGTKRLYARIPQGSDLVPVMRASGFSPVMGETVLGGQSGTLTFATVRGRVRRQHRTDVWAIHQLYMSTVPQPVQYAEALTSHHWDIHSRFSTSTLHGGWLIEEGYRVVAYLRAESRPDSHVLEFMIEPERREHFPALITAALSDLATMSARPVYIVARGYQEEYLPMLQDRGFAIQLEQDLYVKYTTASARTQAATVVTFPPQDVKEPAAKRVPTFLKGSPGDPASESLG
jgi:hypothetical protein